MNTPRETEDERRISELNYQIEALEDEIAECECEIEEIEMEAVTDGPDPLYCDAVKLVESHGEVTCQGVQRKLGIGYGRARCLIDMMVEEGVVLEYDFLQVKWRVVSSV